MDRWILSGKAYPAKEIGARDWKQTTRLGEWVAPREATELSSRLCERRSSSEACAFTLIELLAVIATIVVLAVLLTIASGRVRSSADRALCAGNMRQIGAAAQSYASDNSGTYPLSYDLQLGVNNSVATGLIDRLSAYVGPESEWKIFYCPDAKHCLPPPTVANNLTYQYQLAQTGKARFQRIGYFWLVATASNWRPQSPPDPPPPIKTMGSVQRVLAVCPHFGGGVVHNRLQNALFSDGRVESRKATAAGGIITYLNQQDTTDGQEALTFRN